MNFGAKLSITIPASIYSISCAIARALDSDVGGASSFGPEIEGATEYTTVTPCTSEFLSQALYLISNPEALHAAVSADYATRWQDLIPPTLDECSQFCAAAIIQQC